MANKPNSYCDIDVSKCKCKNNNPCCVLSPLDQKKFDIMSFTENDCLLII